MSAKKILNKPPYSEVQFSIDVASYANNATRSEEHLQAYIAWLKQQPADAKFWMTGTISRTIAEEIEHVQLRMPILHRLHKVMVRMLTTEQLNRLKEILDEIGTQPTGFSFQMLDDQYLGIGDRQ